jgi:hypothetical protein
VDPVRTITPPPALFDHDRGSGLDSVPNPEQVHLNLVAERLLLAGAGGHHPGGDGQHGADEYADTTTIAPYYRALREFLDDPGERPTGLPWP